MRQISAATARRIALAAQGFAERQRSAEPNRAAVLRVLDRIQLLQIDSVSAVVRAHYSPIFSRIGGYDRDLVDDAAWTHSARRPRALVEYWAHEAALIPVEDWPLMRWRMRKFADGRWGGASRVLDRNPRLAKDILDAIAEIGAASTADVERHLEVERPERKGSWWNRSDAKIICEQLFAAGELSVGKRVGFTRHYDLADRVLPPQVRAREVSEADAVRELVRRSAVALGIGTEPDLRDYYRLHRSQTEPAIADLVEEGFLEPVEVAGWAHKAYLHVDARVPRRITGAALLCPFDPLVFCRPRTERIFDFHYRIEIYTPEPKRVHGYYVFPFLLDGVLVGRVDLRAERGSGRLLVPGAFAEPGHETPRVATELAASLRQLADWLELDDIVVGERGNLAELVAPLANR
ncbi:winged helix-turn-helix domain-containing protein [Antrihabitans stalactiti]|uniref:Winged helix-turn-helix domain-containing protein n=1 Tax=Antrihabitans stalactiti TaxID=2584121 RepID=A0A848KDC6_9NOCA|nr:crosslink repair DNA glycosylase YcaQ family protein [Antrihabitans stalactiti]NMN94160.1 winged helix-turn-helix domain-containing protein [Antrihabitans stalactiti]